MHTTTPPTGTVDIPPFGAEQDASPSWTGQAEVAPPPKSMTLGHNGEEGSGQRHAVTHTIVAPPSSPPTTNAGAEYSAAPVTDSPGAGPEGAGGGHRRRVTRASNAAPAPSSPWGAIVTLAADLLDDIERARICAENQLRAALETKGLDPVLNAQHLAPIHETIAGLLEVEGQAIRRLQAAMKRHPLGAFVQETPGLGAKTVGRFLGAVGPLEARTTPAQLWAYCGLHVVDGAAPRRRRGEVSNWSTRAKTRAYLMAWASVKQAGGETRRRSPYRDTYERALAHDAELQAGRPVPLTDGHMRARAMRKVSKAILRDLWAEARKGKAGS